jgi:hypothetical protein
MITLFIAVASFVMSLVVLFLHVTNTRDLTSDTAYVDFAYISDEPLDISVGFEEGDQQTIRQGYVDGSKVVEDSTVLINTPNVSGVFKVSDGYLRKYKPSNTSERTVVSVTKGDKYKLHMFHVFLQDSKMNIVDVFNNVSIDTSGTIQAKYLSDGKCGIENGKVKADIFTDGKSVISNGSVTAPLISDGIMHMYYGNVHTNNNK